MWGKVFLSKETRWRGLGVQPSTFRSEVQRANHYTTAPPQFEIRGAIKYFAVSTEMPGSRALIFKKYKMPGNPKFSKDFDGAAYSNVLEVFDSCLE